MNTCTVLSLLGLACAAFGADDIRSKVAEGKAETSLTRRIDPDKSVYGIPFGTTEDEFMALHGKPAGYVRVNGAETAMIYGKTHAFIFAGGKLIGIRITHTILDWKLSEASPSSPFDSIEWQLSNGIESEMNLAQVRKILGKKLTTKRYQQYHYRTEKAEVELDFAHYTSEGEGDEAHKVTGILLRQGAAEPDDASSETTPWAQSNTATPRLQGIVNLPQLKVAVMEFNRESAFEKRSQGVFPEGDGDRAWKVLSILPEQRAVKVAVEGTPEPLLLRLNTGSNSAPASAPTIELANARLWSVLTLYSDLSTRTLLQWPFLPDTTFSLSASPTNRLEAARLLEKALNEKNIVAVSDGDRFTLILPKEQLGIVKPQAPRPAARGPGAPEARTYQPAEIYFVGATLEETFAVYAELIGAERDRTAPRPPAGKPCFYFRNRTPLSRDEVIYAFDTFFRWNNMEVVRGTNGLVKLVEKEK